MDRDKENTAKVTITIEGNEKNLDGHQTLACTTAILDLGKEMADSVSEMESVIEENTIESNAIDEAEDECFCKNSERIDGSCLERIWYVLSEGPFFGVRTCYETTGKE